MFSGSNLGPRAGNVSSVSCNRDSQSRPGWPRMHDPPASTSFSFLLNSAGNGTQGLFPTKSTCKVLNFLIMLSKRQNTEHAHLASSFQRSVTKTIIF